MWTAQLPVFFDSTVHGKPRQLVLVRWREELPDSRLRPLDKLVGTSKLRWATARSVVGPRATAALPRHYDRLAIDASSGPVPLL